MDNSKTLDNFIADFKLALADDNWDRLEQYFARDATYQNIFIQDQHFVGRDAILAFMKVELSAISRAFDSCEIKTISSPRAEEDRLTQSWRCTFQLQELPELVIEGESRCQFNGQLIQSLESKLSADSKPILKQWRDKYGDQLDKQLNTSND